MSTAAAAKAPEVPATPPTYTLADAFDEVEIVEPMGLNVNGDLILDGGIEQVTINDGGYITLPPGGKLEIGNQILWANLTHGTTATSASVAHAFAVATSTASSAYVGMADTAETRAAIQQHIESSVRHILHNNTNGYVRLTNPRPGEIIWEYETTELGQPTGHRRLFDAGATRGITFTSNASTVTYTSPFQVDTPKTLVKEFMKKRLLVKQGRSRSLNSQITPEELKARNTLRDMLTEAEWRRYVTNGFIMVKGQSGKWYQIFNKTSGYHVQVYQDGKRIAALCIHTSADCPPTDHVINMKVLVEIDEEQIYKLSNSHTPHGRSAAPDQKEDSMSLVEFYKDVKANPHKYAGFISWSSSTTTETFALGA